MRVWGGRRGTGKGRERKGESSMRTRGSWHLEECPATWLWVQETFAGWERSRKVAGDGQRNKPQNMQKPFPLPRKINNRFINKFYKAVQLFKVFW